MEPYAVTKANRISFVVMLGFFFLFGHRVINEKVKNLNPQVAKTNNQSFRPTTDLGQCLKNIDAIIINSQLNKNQLPLPFSLFHMITKGVVEITAKYKSFWWLTVISNLVTSIVLLYFRNHVRKNKYQYIVYRILLAASILGALFNFAFNPLVEKWNLVLFAKAIYVICVSNIFLSLSQSYNPGIKDKKRKIQYGPQFIEPQLNGGAGINIASYKREVAPEASRWAAKRGKWPVDIPVKKLSSGITILGEKGSGKSRLMFGIHDEIRLQYPNVPILIHDPKGEWYRTYFDESSDVLFGPNIDGSSTWNIWDDLKKHPEMIHGVLNTAVYAHPSNGDTFWLDNAIRLLENAFSEETFDDARRYLIAKKEANMDDKMFLSIFGTAKLALHDIAKIVLSKPSNANNPTRMDDYLSWKGRIFLLNNPAFAAEQRGAFSLFLSAFLLRALSLPDVPAGQLRLVAFIDEALTFVLPPEIEKLIYTQCRSKGIVIIAGAQRLPDKNLRETGEWSTAENIFAMKVLNLDTQAQLSKRAGDIAYEEKTESKQKDQKGETKGDSETHHARTHAAIPPETFGRLGNRECILFHDQGLTPCITRKMGREQRDILVPRYKARAEVTEFMKMLD